MTIGINSENLRRYHSVTPIFAQNFEFQRSLSSDLKVTTNANLDLLNLNRFIPQDDTWQEK